MGGYPAGGFFDRQLGYTDKQQNEEERQKRPVYSTDWLIQEALDNGIVEERRELPFLDYDEHIVNEPELRKWLLKELGMEPE